MIAHTVQEWDLNTGQTIRTYPSHGAQLSSLALRPFTQSLSPTPSISHDMQEAGDGQAEDDEGMVEDAERNVFLNDQTAEATETVVIMDNPDERVNADVAQLSVIGAPEEADANMEDATSPYDPLFDDDAEGEEVIPSESAKRSNHNINSTSTQTYPQDISLSLENQQTSENSQNTQSFVSQIAQETSARKSTVPAAQLTSVTRQGAAANAISLLSSASYRTFSDDILMTSSMDGHVVLIDRRVPVLSKTSGGVGRLLAGDKAPPWCMSVG